jgi:hypothetical protein
MAVVAVIWQLWDSQRNNIVWRWIEDEGVDTDDLEVVYRWFGQKIAWGRVEATKLCKVFHVLTRMVEEEKGL